MQCNCAECKKRKPDHIRIDINQSEDIVIVFGTWDGVEYTRTLTPTDAIVFGRQIENIAMLQGKRKLKLEERGLLKRVLRGE